MNTASTASLNFLLSFGKATGWGAGKGALFRRPFFVCPPPTPPKYEKTTHRGPQFGHNKFEYVAAAPPEEAVNSIFDVLERRDRMVEGVGGLSDNSPHFEIRAANIYFINVTAIRWRSYTYSPFSWPLWRGPGGGLTFFVFLPWPIGD